MLQQELDVNFQEVVHSVPAGKADVARQKRFAEDRMDTHKNAPLTPKGREQMVRSVVEGGLSKAAAACRFNTTPKTVSKWVDRFRTEGVEGLRDRSSRPFSSPGQTPQAKCAAVEAMRRQRYTGEQIAAALAISPATVSRILRRLGLNRLSALEPAEPVRRYERESPGELIHIDIKKLGKFNQIGHRITGDRRGQSNSRGVGWEYVHVGIDDHSRIAFAKIMPNQKTRSAIAFLKAAVAYYASLGVKIERVMTDNGSCYSSFGFRRACERLGLRHIRTKPYTPKTNGKVERFIQTSLREWAYAQAYPNSSQRQAELPTWLHRYNWHRPHAGIDGKTPISRLGLTEDNVLRLHI
jgi:transposase InsO family protein